jgi:hypothetical protein
LCYPARGRWIEQDLAAMQQTTARQVRTSLARVSGDDLLDAAAALAAHPARQPAGDAEELWEAHDRLIAPHWSRTRAILDASHCST